MKKSIFILLSLSFLLGISSCKHSPYFFMENITIENGIWTAKNQIPFHFTVSDTTSIYKIGFNIRYTDAYPNQNIYIFLHTTFPNNLHTRDTISIDLFSAEGNPLGKGKRVVELQTYFSQVRFPMAGQYTMTLEQAMRTDSLPIVISMGLCISD